MIKKVEILKDYLPDEMWKDKFVDKAFFWPVVFKILPKWSNEYYDLVIKQRRCVKK